MSTFEVKKEAVDYCVKTRTFDREVWDYLTFKVKENRTPEEDAYCTWCFREDEYNAYGEL